jgi:hypothetical protein
MSSQGPRRAHAGGTRRALAVVAILSAFGSWGSAAFAEGAPRDAAAQRKLDEAVRYYAADKFREAEALLLGTIKACEDRCSPALKARLLMYVGIVRADARDDSQAARQAFVQALVLDPCVELDEVLAKGKSVALFEEVLHSQAAPRPVERPDRPVDKESASARFDDVVPPDTGLRSQRPGCPAGDQPPPGVAAVEQPAAAAPASTAAPAAPQPAPAALPPEPSTGDEPGPDVDAKGLHSRYTDAHTDRVILYPTADTHPKGSFYFSSYEVVLLQAGFAFDDSVQATATVLPPYFEEQPYFIDGALKVNVVRSEFQAAVIGGLGRNGQLTRPNEAWWLGRLGAVGQGCFDEACRSSISFGPQWFVPFQGTASSALGLYAGLVGRVSDVVAFLLEPSYFKLLQEDEDSYSFFILSFGVRLSGAHFAADITMIRPFLEDELPFFLGLPFLVFTYRTDWDAPTNADRAMAAGLLGR